MLLHWAGDDFYNFKQHFDIDIVTGATNALKIWNDTSRIFVHGDTFCAAIYTELQDSQKCQTSFLLTRINENWGGLSTYIPNRTVQWGSLEDQWKDQGCTKEDVLVYLNHEKTIAAITTQFQAFDHPKVHSIPLGVKQPDQLLEGVRRNSTVNKTHQLLVINGHMKNAHRYHVRNVLEKFHGTVKNTIRIRRYSFVS